MIIGITGLISAGKDTIAGYLVNIHEFCRYLFSATLKDAVASVFGRDREMMEGRTVFSLWPDQPILPTSHQLLEDCRRQIGMLQRTLQHLNVTALK
jgi:hypothetical protein